MRIARVLVLVAVVALLLASMASAQVRQEARDMAGQTLALVVGDDSTPAADESTEPSPEPSPLATETAEPSPEPSPEADDTAGDAGAHPDNHGAAVSTIARDKEAVGTKTLANGKTVTNHGQAVSAVARSQDGKPEASGGKQDQGGD